MTLIFLIGSGFLMHPEKPSLQDKRAEEIIKASQDFYYNLEDMEIDFSYLVKGISSRQRIQRGSIQIKKAKYVMKMREQETFCDGSRIWVYLPGVNEYMVFSMGEWTYGNIMQLIYSMYFSPSEKAYQGIEMLEDGTRTHKIRFLMKSSDLNYSTAYAWYDEETKLLAKVTFLDRQRRQRTFSFSNLRYNRGVPNETFVFRPQNYPGIELRR